MMSTSEPGSSRSPCPMLGRLSDHGSTFRLGSCWPSSCAVSDSASLPASLGAGGPSGGGWAPSGGALLKLRLHFLPGPPSGSPLWHSSAAIVFFSLVSMTQRRLLNTAQRVNHHQPMGRYGHVLSHSTSADTCCQLQGGGGSWHACVGGLLNNSRIAGVTAAVAFRLLCCRRGRSPQARGFDQVIKG